MQLLHLPCVGHAGSAHSLHDTCTVTLSVMCSSSISPVWATLARHVYKPAWLGSTRSMIRPSSTMVMPFPRRKNRIFMSITVQKESKFNIFKHGGFQKWLFSSMVVLKHGCFQTTNRVVFKHGGFQTWLFSNMVVFLHDSFKTRWLTNIVVLNCYFRL